MTVEPTHTERGGRNLCCGLCRPLDYAPLTSVNVSTGRVLAKWFRSSSMLEQFSLSEEQDMEPGESPGDVTPSDMTRYSVMSNDSGIERDLPPGADPSTSSSLDSAGISASWEQHKR